MFGSQALDTAIGLVLMFFIISTAASTIVEIFSRLLNKRATHLEQALKGLLQGTADLKSSEAADALNALKGTSAYDLARAGGGFSLIRRLQEPAYLSAKSYADAVIEMLLDSEGRMKTLGELPPGLRKRLTAIVLEVGHDLTGIRARLERGFDETMDRIEGSYKRWATLMLFAVGLVIAGASNASTFAVASDLWKDSATRQVVVDAASGVAADKDAAAKITSVAAATDTLKELSLPVGWTEKQQTTWASTWWRPFAWARGQWLTFAGWLTTGLLVMLGGPFWFDLLTRLVSLRSSGSKPTQAPEDPTSASFALKSRRAAQIYPDPAPAAREGESLHDWVEDQLAKALRVTAPSG